MAHLALQAPLLTSVCISPDNSLVCLCGAQPNCAQGGYAASTALVIDLKTGVPRYEFPTSGIHAAFSPDGKTLAAFTEQMELFDEPGFSSFGKQTLPGVRHWPTGKLLRERQLLNRRASWIELFDVATGKTLSKLQDPELQQAGPLFTWNHDGTQIATMEGAVTHVHDVASRKITRTLTRSDDTPTICSFMPGVINSDGWLSCQHPAMEPCCWQTGASLARPSAEHHVTGSRRFGQTDDLRFVRWLHPLLGSLAGAWLC